MSKKIIHAFIIVFITAFVFLGLSEAAFASNSQKNAGTDQKTKNFSNESSSFSDVSISGSVSKNQVFIGDEIEYEISVVHPFGITVEMPPFASNLGAFEIKDYKRPESIAENDFVTEKVKYIISTFTTGKYVIPPVAALYTDINGKVIEIKTEPMEIDVKSVAAIGDEMKEIKKLKPGILIPAEKNYRLWYFAAAFVLVIIILILLFKKTGDNIEVTVQIVMEPQKEAFKALDALAKSGLIQKERFREFYYNLSEILRRYLADIFEPVSMDQVTHEMISSLKSVQGLTKDEVMLISDMMSDFDMVKYAKDLRNDDAAFQALERVGGLVEITKRYWPVTSKSASEDTFAVNHADNSVANSVANSASGSENDTQAVAHTDNSADTHTDVQAGSETRKDSDLKKGGL